MAGVTYITTYMLNTDIGHGQGIRSQVPCTAAVVVTGHEVHVAPAAAVHAGAVGKEVIPPTEGRGVHAVIR
jgi:hypothetical protein